jgi:hypothetical protein
MQVRRIPSAGTWIVFGVVASLVMPPGVVAGVGTWVPLVNLAPGGIGGLLLLSDGTVMCTDNGTQTNWYRLTPDQHGSYINGNWTNLASMHYQRSGFAADVVPDGRLFVAGGEYPENANGPGSIATNAEIYDPVTNGWTDINPPLPLFNPVNGDKFGDMISVVISNGSVLMAPISPRDYGGTLFYNPKSNVWSNGPVLTNYVGNENECSWAKLADGSILTIDPASRHSQRYIPALNRWVPDGDVPGDVWNNNGGGDEIGPAVTLPNGQAFFMGANGTNVLYTPSGNANPGLWTLATLSPTNLDGTGHLTNLVIADAPAAMMVNGKVLCILGAGEYNGGILQPLYCYEYDYSTGSGGSFTPVPGPGGGPTISGSSTMLDLPDGTVLLSDFTSQLYVYQPDGAPLPAGKPAITSITANADGSFHLTGMGLNGISEGATYGDDFQNNENYPLVRMANNASGFVYYARTYNWSSTGIQTGSTPESTEFMVPTNLPPGTNSLVVVANGIASDPKTFYGPVWVDFNTAVHPGNGTYATPYDTLALGISAVPAEGTIFIKPGSSTEKPTITKPMTIIAIGGAATVGQ